MNGFARIKEKLNSKFLNSLGWLGASEALVRLTRLLTAVVLARVLGPTEFGVAALVITVNELIRVFNRNGISAKIIQCSDNELDTICNTAYRVNFIFCISLFGLQLVLAYPIAQWYEVPELVPMLQVLALTYLLMPFGLVHAALVQREQNMKSAALVDGGQVAVDNVMTAALALMGLGAWAIVLPKFLTSPIWVLGYRKSYSWQPNSGFFIFDQWQNVFSFGKYYLGIETFKAIRLNVDNLIIGRLLGVEVLGLYYFAKNAGLGFSLTLTNSINTALYPNLCEVRENQIELARRFKTNLKQIAFIVIPLLSLQAGLAYWYVPLIFGEHWAHAVPVLALLCLSAIPRAFAESSSALMMSNERIKMDFNWNLIFTIFFVIFIFVGAIQSIGSVALAYLMVFVICCPAYTVWAWRINFPTVTDSREGS